MANDLKDLGSNTSLFDFVPDWVSSIDFNLDVIRHYVRFPGGYPYMRQKSEFTPAQWSAEYVMTNKADENEFLLYLSERQGNVQRFWAVYPRTIFHMKSDWESTDISCESNDFHFLHKGQERVFLVLNNGDLITRRVSSAVNDKISNTLTLVVANAPDAGTVTPADVAIFGRLYLARFNMVSFACKARTDSNSSFNLDFLEVNEYGDTDL